MEKSKQRKILRAVIALLSAVVIWRYVDTRVDANCTPWIRDVPVEFSYEDTTLAEKNLMLLSGYDTTIDLRLKGPRRTLWKMDYDAVRVVVDTRAIETAGQQSLPWTVEYPASVPRGTISVEDASAYTVTVTVGELYTKEVPVYCEVNGEAAAGFFAGDLECDTEKIVLRAQREDLLNVSYAKVAVNMSGATKTIIQALDYTLYDYNHVPVENSNIRSATKLVQITLPIRTRKNVPLEIELVGAPLEEPSAVQYDIKPQSVDIIGEASTLEAITSILLDKIYLEDLNESQTFHYNVKAPIGTSLAQDALVADVTVMIEGAADLVVTAGGITCENVAEGLKATPPESLDVTVWGLESEVTLVAPENVIVLVDMSGVTAPGEYVLPAVVTLQNHDKVSVKGEYTVNVTVTERAVEAVAVQKDPIPSPEQTENTPDASTNHNGGTPIT